MSDGLLGPGGGSGDDRANGTDDPGTNGSGTNDSGTNGAHGDGMDSEEQALRRLLQDSVRDIEPSPESLEALQRAVPARRQHRRQALVGVVAAALVAVVGIPALLYGGVVPGVGDDRHPLTASSSHGETQGPGEGSESGGGKEGEQRGKDGGKDGKDKDEKDKDKTDPSSPSGGKESGGADPSDSLVASAPTCGREQLGNGSSQAGSPGADGKVYGSFRVTNTSGDACTVDGEGMVGASTEGNARARVQVAVHTPGDPATGLPDPAAESDELVLKPGESYLVRFAWVPNQGGTCADSTPSPETSAQSGAATDAEPPTAGAETSGGGETTGGTDSGGGTGGSEGPGDGGATGGGDSGGGTGEDPKVVISHTPDVGTPAAADAVVDGACGGTVYRTGVLPAK
ncbi:hypothetical protein GCM10009801_07500 [Streptomyces albiaxialis]|uniref:DUF4232 domain-containing protein n=1 Tax=Streptomyces albiaxialis TaxID=329523 RepID=A0ABN2VIR1_9ACTN